MDDDFPAFERLKFERVSQVVEYQRDAGGSIEREFKRASIVVVRFDDDAPAVFDIKGCGGASAASWSRMVAQLQSMQSKAAPVTCATILIFRLHIVLKTINIMINKQCRWSV